LLLSRELKKLFGVRLSGVLLIEADFWTEGVGVGVGVPRDIGVGGASTALVGDTSVCFGCATWAVGGFAGAKSEAEVARFGEGGKDIGDRPTLTHGRTVYVLFAKSSTKQHQPKRKDE
jgi:hypothetical protein